MNKKVIAIAITILFVLALAYSGVSYFMSFKAVRIDIPRNGVSATIYDAKGTRVATLSGSEELSLRTGEYRIIPGGTNIATDELRLKVTDDTQLTIDPGYSAAYLDTLLDKQDSIITGVLNTAYPSVLQRFTINPGSLYGYGDWFATTLVEQSPGPGASGDIYRTVLHKDDDGWKIAATPAIVLSAKDSPSVPMYILTFINADPGY